MVATTYRHEKKECYQTGTGNSSTAGSQPGPRNKPILAWFLHAAYPTFFQFHAGYYFVFVMLNS